MATTRAPSITTTLDKLFAGKDIIGQGTGQERTTKIVSMTPVPNSKQLVVKGLSYGTKLYPLTMNIFGVEYSTTAGRDYPLSVNAPNGSKLFAAQIPFGGTLVQCRCSCPNFYFSWGFYNNREKALAGPPLPPYTRKTTTHPSPNPGKVEGLCKHLKALTNRLIQARILVK